MDLTDLVRADPAPVCDLDDYYPDILANYRWRGRLWGLPWIAQPVVLYCNLDLFEGAGVAPPDGAWDWEAFLSAARRVSAHEWPDGVERWGFVIEPGWPPLEMYAWQNGAELLDVEGRVRLTDARVTEAAEFLQDLVHRHKAAPPVDTVLERGISNLFRDGRVAMFAGGAADDLDRIEGLPVVVRELPSGPGGRRATFAWNAGLHVSAATRRPELAYKAWKDLLAAIQAWKIAPPRRSLASQIETIEPRKAAAAEVIRRSMEYMRPIRLIRERRQWDSVLDRLFKGPLVRGEADARTLAREVAPLLEEIAEGGGR
jgi:multiple sugar transport system substrate-binding protein